MFHLACMNGRYKIVEFVLRRSDLEFKMKRYIHSIDLNAKTNGDETAFYLAFVHGHSDVVKILMENAGIDLNLDREYAFRGWTVFHEACKRGHSNVVMNSDVVMILMKNSAIFNVDLT